MVITASAVDEQEITSDESLQFFCASRNFSTTPRGYFENNGFGARTLRHHTRERNAQTMVNLSIIVKGGIKGS